MLNKLEKAMCEQFEWPQLGLDTKNKHVTALKLPNISNIGKNTVSFVSKLGGILKKFEYLEELSLGYFCMKDRINDFPDFISNFKFLKKLNLEGNKIKSIPPWIDSLKNLEEIIICWNLITEIPESIGNLRNLRNFDISRNKIIELPESIGNLIFLEYLNLSCTKIQHLPLTSKNLKNLKELDFSVELNSFPEEICSLNSLEILNLGNNLVVPDTISKLVNLKELRFGRNCVLPESIGQLKSLEILFCDDNCTIPHSIGELKKLRELFIGGQCKLPRKNIEKLSSLTSLWTKIADYRDENDFRTITSSIPKSCVVYDHEEWLY